LIITPPCVPPAVWEAWAEEDARGMLRSRAYRLAGAAISVDLLSKRELSYERCLVAASKAAGNNARMRSRGG
jgi:hypothetical protein